MKDDVAEIFNPLSVDYTFRPLSHKHEQTTDRLLGCALIAYSNLLFYNAGARTQTFRTLGVRTPP